MQIVIRNGKVTSWYKDNVDVDKTQINGELVWMPDEYSHLIKPTYDEHGDIIYRDDPRPNLPADYRSERDQLKAAIQNIADPNTKKVLAYLARKILKE